MKSDKLLLICLTSAVLLDAQALSTTVIDENGLGVASVALRYWPVPDPRVSVPGIDHSAERPISSILSDSKGSANFPAVAAGHYYVCASPKDTNFVDECRWSGVQKISIGAGVVSKTVRLRRGRLVRINLSDALGLLASKGRSIVPGVRTAAGAIHVAEAVSRTSGSRIHEITVPRDVELGLWLHASGFLVQDSKDRRLGTSGPDSGIIIAPGEQTENITLSIVGLTAATGGR